METNVPTLPTGKKEEEAKPLIVKFQLSIKDAGYRYHGWVEKQRNVPKDFDIAGNKEKIKGIWVPAWVFDVSATTSWHGRNYHTEYRTVTKYRRNEVTGKDVPYTDSEEYEVPDYVSSTHRDDYILPVSASRVITQKEIELLKLKRSDLQSYDESYMGEWEVQSRDLEKTEAKEICENRIKELEILACCCEVRELDGCSTAITWNTSSFALLPMFVLAYTYKDGFYRNLISGLTGEVLGGNPFVPPKPLLWVLLFFLIVGFILLNLFIRLL